MEYGSASLQSPVTMEDLLRSLLKNKVTGMATQMNNLRYCLNYPVDEDHCYCFVAVENVDLSTDLVDAENAVVAAEGP